MRSNGTTTNIVHCLYLNRFTKAQHHFAEITADFLRFEQLIETTLNINQAYNYYLTLDKNRQQITTIYGCPLDKIIN